MPYITSIERLARKEGRQEGLSALMLGLLSERFGPLSENDQLRVGGAPVEALEQWGRRLLAAKSLDEVLA